MPDGCVANFPSMSRRKSATLTITICVLAALSYAAWPRGLELYTSPPITFHGKTVRLQALIPNGWVAYKPQTYGSSDIPSFIGHRSIPAKGMVYVTIQPQNHPYGWMPEWLGRWVHGSSQGEVFPAVVLQWGLNSAEQSDHVVSTTSSTIGPKTSVVGLRGSDADNGYSIVYIRQKEDAFDATYRQICESFKVVR